MIHAAFMNFLEHRILQEGIVKEGNILKVDSFLNHQIDMGIMKEIAHEFQCRFKDCSFKVSRMLSFLSGGYQGATAERRVFLSFLATGWRGEWWAGERWLVVRVYTR